MHRVLVFTSVLLGAIGCTVPTAEVGDAPCAAGCEALSSDANGQFWIEDGSLRFAPLDAGAFAIEQLKIAVTPHGGSTTLATIDQSLAVSDLASSLGASDYPIAIEVTMRVSHPGTQLIGIQVASGLSYAFSIGSADDIPKSAPRELPQPFGVWPIRLHGKEPFGMVHPHDYVATLRDRWLIDGKQTISAQFISVPAVRPYQMVDVSFVVGSDTKHLDGWLLTKIGSAESVIKDYTIDGAGDWMIVDGTLRRPLAGELPQR